MAGEEVWFSWSSVPVDEISVVGPICDRLGEIEGGIPVKFEDKEPPANKTLWPPSPLG